MIDDPVAGPDDPIALWQADEIAKQLTDGHVRVLLEAGVVTLRRDGQRLPIGFLPDQLTRRRIETAVAEN
jgi:DNA-binding transcriptional ArsR family regulator